MALPKRVLRDPPYTVGQRPPIPGYGLGASVIVCAGRLRAIVVTPEGDPDGAWTREEWDRVVEVYVSPQGWNTRVFVDGVEVV